MPFIKEILKYDSLSIVGLEKNVGKTECLNYILSRLPLQARKVAVTSIGIDGESKDQVTATKKPEIYLREGVLFSTSETYYKKRKLVSELVDITNERSSLGRVVTGKVRIGGKVMLSGPSSNPALSRWIRSVRALGADITIIDGAISRLSLASPAISQAMILSTGAALSSNVNTLVRKTKYVVELINLPTVHEHLFKLLEHVENGVWGVDCDGKAVDLGLRSSLAVTASELKIPADIKYIYTAGALTDTFLKKVASGAGVKDLTLVVRDFTKIFIDEMVYRNFMHSGGRIAVLQKSRLLAVCVNPVAPNGFVLDSDILCEKLRETIGFPVYDIVKNRYDI